LSYLYSQENLQTGSGFAAFLPIILIGIVFYLLILRPQNKQRKNHEDTLSNLKKGDKIITRGGVYGTIINFQGKNNSKVVIDVGSGTKLKISRSYIVDLAKKPEE
tara:strand:- start:88 stop:402 length:315 start_codon:yes stop_codon:yes gene_type:complete